MELREQMDMLPSRLLPWFAVSARPLPWREDKEPYHIWLSEIMLQQTRVEAVKGYYSRFLKAVPDISSLASADDELLSKLWEGLGYYSRVRSMKTAAQQIMTQFEGVFPTTLESIQGLKGIGPYTAGAIASICFNQPTPAVDGNVLRVITRLTGDLRPIDEEKTKKDIRNLLASVYPKESCGDFTQALMELGATVCLPNGTPDCERCPVADICFSRNGEWKNIPQKLDKKPRRKENLTVFVFQCDDYYAVRKRPMNGLLAGMWEYPNVSGKMDAQEAISYSEKIGIHPKELEKVLFRRHIFSHIEWEMNCYYIQCSGMPDDFTWVTEEELDSTIALPTAFRMFRDAEESC